MAFSWNSCWCVSPCIRRLEVAAAVSNISCVVVCSPWIAEYALLSFEKQESYGMLLLTLAGTSDLDGTTQLTAAIAFKNYVWRNWREVRLALLQLLMALVIVCSFMVVVCLSVFCLLWLLLLLLSCESWPLLMQLHGGEAVMCALNCQHSPCDLPQKRRPSRLVRNSTSTMDLTRPLLVWNELLWDWKSKT